MSDKLGNSAVNLDNLSTEIDYRTLRVRQVDLLQQRMELLKKTDRLFLDLYLNHNLCFHRIAQLAHLPDRCVAKRITRLMQRLLSEEYISIIRNKNLFKRSELEVAYDRYLLGMGYRRIAIKRNLGLRTTQRILDQLHLWLSKNLKKHPKRKY